MCSSDLGQAPLDAPYPDSAGYNLENFGFCLQLGDESDLPEPTPPPPPPTCDIPTADAGQDFVCGTVGVLVGYPLGYAVPAAHRPAQFTVPNSVSGCYYPEQSQTDPAMCVCADDPGQTPHTYNGSTNSTADEYGFCARTQ